MLEQVKQILIEKYKQKIEEYEVIKNEIIELENKILNDNSENNYKEDLKNLRKSKLKKKSDEYKTQLENIENIYKKSLLDFKEVHEKYSELRRRASLVDIYGYTRKMTMVENAKELKDIKLDEEKATKILSGELEDII